MDGMDKENIGPSMRWRRLLNGLFGCMGAAVALGVLRGTQIVARQGYWGRGLENVARTALREQIGTFAARGFFAGVVFVLFLAVARKIQKNRTRRLRALALAPVVLALLFAGVVEIVTLFMRGNLAGPLSSSLSPWVVLVRAVLPALSDPISLPRPFIAMGALAALVLSFGLASVLERLIFRRDPAVREERPTRLWPAYTGVTLLVGAAMGYSALRPDFDDRRGPDIFLISIDTLRADHVGAYGYHRPTTPNLDLLAADGVVVRDHISHTPWTLPSHVSMFTGRLPYEHGVTSINKALAAKTPVLGEYVKERGYHTAAFVTNYLLSPTFGYGSGIDLYVMRADFPAKEIVRLAKRWVARTPEPAFAFLHVYDAHYPYKPGPSVRGKFHDPDDGLDEMMNTPFFDFAKAAMDFFGAANGGRDRAVR
ncbi:MAG: sulfatase-like hydrolase/transferase [Deltaproteobacteria bacterium]|nr:sulfatase-like hydrolase/transferase [Deltaproteobacteria bacterium]